MRAAAKKRQKLRVRSLENASGELANRVWSVPQRSGNGNERPKTQQKVQNAPKMCPRAKHGANLVSNRLNNKSVGRMAGPP